jgi:hypothetical protein
VKVVDLAEALGGLAAHRASLCISRYLAYAS